MFDAPCHFDPSAMKWRMRRAETPADGLRVGTTTPGGVTKRATVPRESNLLLLSGQIMRGVSTPVDMTKKPPARVTHAVEAGRGVRYHFDRSAAKWRIRRAGTPADGLRGGTTTPGGVTKRASVSGERESNLSLFSDQK